MSKCNCISNKFTVYSVYIRRIKNLRLFLKSVIDCCVHVGPIILINATIFYWKFNSLYKTPNKKSNFADVMVTVRNSQLQNFAQLTQWGRILLGKLIAFQFFKNFSDCYGTTCFITTFVTAQYKYIFWTILLLKPCPFNIHFSVIFLCKPLFRGRFRLPRCSLVLSFSFFFKLV